MTPRRETGAALIAEANKVVQEQVVAHERDDEGNVYPRLASILRESHGLSAMSRAHREILHLARLLARVVEDLPTEKIDRYLIRDAQRVIEAIETLVRMHTAQEDDIYEAVAARDLRARSQHETRRRGKIYLEGAGANIPHAHPVTARRPGTIVAIVGGSQFGVVRNLRGQQNSMRWEVAVLLDLLETAVCSRRLRLLLSWSAI